MLGIKINGKKVMRLGGTVNGPVGRLDLLELIYRKEKSRTFTTNSFGTLINKRKISLTHK